MAEQAENTCPEPEGDIRDELKAYIVSRAGSGLMDLLLAAVMAVLLFLAFFLPVRKLPFYTDLQDRTRAVYADSGLFGEDLDPLPYDASAYDAALEHYYSADADAIRNGFLAEYRSSAESTGLFEQSGGSRSVRKDADPDAVQRFLSGEYETALKRFSAGAEIRRLSMRGMSIPILIAFLTLTASLLLFYLAVPLKTERHQTLGQKVNAIRPVDYSSLFSVSRRQLLIRFLAYALFYCYLPLFLLFWAGGEAVLLFAFPVIFNITFKYHRGVQDLLSSTIMIDIRKEGMNDLYGCR